MAELDTGEPSTATGFTNDKADGNDNIRPRHASGGVDGALPQWCRAAAVRAVKTAAQAALGVIGTGAIGLIQVDWLNVASVAALAAVVSLLTSIVGVPEVAGGDAVTRLN